VQPFHQAFGLRIGRLADLNFRGEGATKLLTRLGQLDPAAAPPTDRALTIPDQHPRRGAQRVDELPPAGI
jgi:hypothetical protein